MADENINHDMQSDLIIFANSIDRRAVTWFDDHLKQRKATKSRMSP